jgi:hypothetical protein
MDPALSVVVIVFAGRDWLERCLAALARQHDGPALQIIVPHDVRLRDVESLRVRHADVRFVTFDGTCTPAELRAQGVARASGRVIALLEDHCVPAPDWSARIMAAHERQVAAVGGSVEKGLPPGARDDSAVNWALYLADYSRYMGPHAAGEAHTITDCNSSYKRADLEAVRAAWQVEFHENVVNDALRARGAKLWLDPAIVVHEQRTLAMRDALRDRFTFGRLFGATRVAGAPASRRVVLAAASAVIPPLQVARVARNLMAKRKHRMQLVRALPALLMVSGAWAAGEMLGYVTGSPGSLQAAVRP